MNPFLQQDFCFTGKAKLRGTDVTRGELEAFIERNGGRVSKKVGHHTDILVASRSDTTKARDAINLGKRVCTYDEFFTMAGVMRLADLQGPAQPMDPWRKRDQEQREAAERVEAKKAARRADKLALEQAETEIEGWGMF
jgi:BRCT domain type II-containing protein